MKQNEATRHTPRFLLALTTLGGVYVSAFGAFLIDYALDPTGDSDTALIIVFAIVVSVVIAAGVRLIYEGRRIDAIVVFLALLVGAFVTYVSILAVFIATIGPD